MNPFLEACGLTAPWRLTVESNGAPVPELTAFETPFLIVGQDQGVDLRLPHKDVSERHAFLQWIAGRLQVTDLGSRTGVLYEGRRQRVGWLDPGQSIRIGPYRLALAELEPAPARNESPPIPALGLDMKLRGIRAVSARAEGPLVVLGSATDCELRLLDPAVASYHCAIVNAPQGSWIVDLLGAGGITVNGENTRSALLSEGDLIVVGRSTIRIASIAWLDHVEHAARTSHSDDPPAPRASEPPPLLEPVSVPMPVCAETVVESLTEVPMHAESTAAVLHHPAHEHVPPPASYVEPVPPPAVADAPVGAAETATEPRRGGFFGAWRRGPVAVPNRAPAAPSMPLNGFEELSAPAPIGRAQPTATMPAREAPAPTATRCEDPAPTRSNWSAPPSQSFESTFPSGPEGAERRGSCRYSISGRIARISWWEPTGPQRDGRLGSIATGGANAGPNESVDAQNRTLNVSMVDVSQAGLAVLSPVAPARGERVWFRLDDAPALDWVELIAVGHSSAGNGNHLVRFAFRETCPYDLFKALVFTGGSSRS